MNRIVWTLAIIGTVCILIAPILLTRDWSCFDFTSTGQIGDTIGGTTAPIIGLLSIILLVLTLKEQISFNIKQKDLTADEQFKATFFNLLQVQRDILEKISGSFSYLGFSVDREHIETDSNDLRIFRKEKEFASVKIENNVIKGLDFFKSAKYQLTLIFEALDFDTFENK